MLGSIPQKRPLTGPDSPPDFQPPDRPLETPCIPPCKSPMIMLLITGDIAGPKPCHSCRDLRPPKKAAPLCCPCGSHGALPPRTLQGVLQPRQRRDRGPASPASRERILARDHHTCRVCYSPAPLVVHHRRPSNVSTSADHPLPGVPRAPPQIGGDRPLGSRPSH